MKYRCKPILAATLAVLALGGSAAALADPPGRVARLGYSSGAVSFSAAGDDQWVQADLNRPLVPGDRLWTDDGARDELQVGSAAVRMQGDTLLSVLNLDDRVVQLQLSQGRLNVRVRELAPDGVFEIDTPNLALTLRQPGDYRVDVDPDGNATSVMVRAGQVQADGQGASWLIDAGQSYRFDGADLRNYQVAAAAPADEFDRWAAARDRRSEQSVSARYVPRDLVGYDDLDENGTWRSVEDYGNVWVPSHVQAGWTPYRDGHWAWVEPWGWTWVDDAPWGFAVTHYGRWAHLRGDWCWVPGPAAARPVYAPALVAFVGGASLLGANRGGVAWFPLGPREVYRPAYHVSRNYFNNINASNTTLNRTQIVNVYNQRTSNINYINRQVNGAVVAVPVATFAQSRPVGKSAVMLPRQSVDRVPVLPGAGVRPQRASIAGNGAPGHRPAAALLSRPVLARTAPPRPSASFPGQPATARPAPQVRMLNTGQPARPIAAAAPPRGPGPLEGQAHGHGPLAGQPPGGHEPGAGQPRGRPEGQGPGMARGAAPFAAPAPALDQPAERRAVHHPAVRPQGPAVQPHGDAQAARPQDMPAMPAAAAAARPAEHRQAPHPAPQPGPAAHPAPAPHPAPQPHAVAEAHPMPPPHAAAEAHPMPPPQPHPVPRPEPQGHPGAPHEGGHPPPNKGEPQKHE